MGQGLSLRCKGIGGGQESSNEFVKIPITMKTFTGEPVIIIGEIHLIDNLSCDMLIGNDIMKPSNVVIKWGTFGQSNVAVIQNKQEVPVKATKPLGVTINLMDTEMEQDQPSAKKLMRKPIPVKISRSKKFKRVTVYAAETIIMEPNTGQNVNVRHRALPTDKDYVFQPIPIMDLGLETFTSGMNAVVNDNPETIPMANFGSRQVKIRKNQVIGTLSTRKSTAKETSVNFSVTEVFTGKCEVEPDLSYIIDFPDEPSIEQAEISEHWGQDY